VIKAFSPFLSFEELNVDDIDIYDDAWGFNCQFPDIVKILNLVEPVPPPSVISRLMEKIEDFSGRR